MAAYYNEIDPYAAQWLRNLIAAGHIAPGDVDERSIVDVRPDDLKGYRQCHFFAGIGVWSYALRKAGFSDEEEVWTGSCPCQPFSAAGKGEAFDDERDLWPAFFALIRERRPVLVAGEQVASRLGLAWLDALHADLEGEAYTVGAVDTCSAGVGSPNIRQRLYWVAHAERWPAERHGHTLAGEASGAEGQAHERQRLRADVGNGGGLERVGNAGDARLEGHGGSGVEQIPHGRQGKKRHGAEASAPSRMADANRGGGGRDTREMGVSESVNKGSQQEFRGFAQTIINGCADGLPSPLNGYWRAADWLCCTDGKWRPVESGTFPLATGIAGRVGRLRAYGNAINAEVATEFLRAVRSAA
jgi:DNA (cytosine-5)-methyltransferase 1